jgi:protein TonB
MSHELFHDVTNTRPRAGRATGGTLAVSVVAHAAILAAVIVVPLLATDTLPTLSDPVDSFIPVAPPPPPAAAPAVDRTQARRAETPHETTPLAPPEEIRAEDPRPSAGHFPIDDGGPTVPGDVGGVIGGTEVTVAQPTPPPPPPVPDRPIRVTAINMPTKLRDVAPIYPAIAQRANIDGTVIVEAVIAVDGSVRDARVLKSIPLLDRAALDAVKQWRYAPTRLNGVAVPVIVTVTVRFRLQR